MEFHEAFPGLIVRDRETGEVFEVKHVRPLSLILADGNGYRCAVLADEVSETLEEVTS